MGDIKSYEIKDLSNKYGFSMVGYVAVKPILKGEVIIACDEANCMYKDWTNRFTKNQINELLAKHPEKKNYIHKYFLMIDDDLFQLPPYYKTLEITCDCPLVNHSCNPNCEYRPYEYLYPLVARRDIEIGEELCIHYGTHDSESSLITGMKCLCGSPNCVGILQFDFWRDPIFQKKYQRGISPYINRKINKLKETIEN